MLFGDEDKMTDDLLDAVLKKVQAGAAIDYEGVAISYANPFYILGLAPNAARLSVRFFLQGSFGDFLRNLAPPLRGPAIHAPLHPP